MVISLALRVVVSDHPDTVHDVDQRVFLAVWPVRRGHGDLPHLDLDEIAQFIDTLYMSDEGSLQVLV